MSDVMTKIIFIVLGLLYGVGAAAQMPINDSIIGYMSPGPSVNAIGSGSIDIVIRNDKSSPSDLLYLLGAYAREQHDGSSVTLTPIEKNMKMQSVKPGDSDILTLSWQCGNASSFYIPVGVTSNARGIHDVTVYVSNPPLSVAETKQADITASLDAAKHELLISGANGTGEIVHLDLYDALGRWIDSQLFTILDDRTIKISIGQVGSLSRTIFYVLSTAKRRWFGRVQVF